jgi:hypothetical protein
MCPATPPPAYRSVVPSQNFFLGLRSALKLKTLHLRSSHRLEDHQFDLFIGWFLRELLSDQEHSPPVKAVTPGIAGIISMTLSQERQYPQLKNVDMQFTSVGAGSGEESDSGHREEIELAMHALKARGVLRLLWE